MSTNNKKKNSSVSLLLSFLSHDSAKCRQVISKLMQEFAKASLTASGPIPIPSKTKKISLIKYQHGRARKKVQVKVHKTNVYIHNATKAHMDILQSFKIPDDSIKVLIKQDKVTA